MTKISQQTSKFHLYRILFIYLKACVVFCFRQSHMDKNHSDVKCLKVKIKRRNSTEKSIKDTGKVAPIHLLTRISHISGQHEPQLYARQSVNVETYL